MNAWSSIIAKFHDHFTPSGRRESKPRRDARKAASKARARQMSNKVRQSEQTRFYD